VLKRATLERDEELVEIGAQNIGGTLEPHAEAGVEHVGRRHTACTKRASGPTISAR